MGMNGEKVVAFYYTYEKDSPLVKFSWKDIQRVKEELARKEMKTSELAERCILTRGTIKLFLSEGKIRLHQLKRILGCLGIEDELVERHRITWWGD